MGCRSHCERLRDFRSTLVHFQNRRLTWPTALFSRSHDLGCGHLRIPVGRAVGVRSGGGSPEMLFEEHWETEEGLSTPTVHAHTDLWNVPIRPHFY